MNQGYKFVGWVRQTGRLWRPACQGHDRIKVVCLLRTFDGDSRVVLPGGETPYLTGKKK